MLVNICRVEVRRMGGISSTLVLKVSSITQCTQAAEPGRGLVFCIVTFGSPLLPAQTGRLLPSATPVLQHASASSLQTESEVEASTRTK